jgi:ABC-type sugar transport system permease subunit
MSASEVAGYGDRPAGRRRTLPPRHVLARRILPYLFISPFFILFGAFSVYPLIQALYLSTMKWAGSGEMQFVGLRNYINLASDPVFLQSLGNTVYYAVVAVGIILPAALGLALIVNSALVRAKSFFRVGMILPNLTSTVAAAIIFTLMFDHNYGLFNGALKAIGFKPVMWLDPGLVKISVLLVATWRYIGINMLYFLAGLQGIPEELYEAAAVDGAGNTAKFWHITLPLLRPIAMFVVILTIIGSFQLFAEPMILAGGGPKNASLTIANYLYRSGFQFSRLGYASAIGYVLAFIILVLSLIQIRLFRPREGGN